jgi:4-diphosphocytidyl-2C-methyl-D-erythritol kinase
MTRTYAFMAARAFFDETGIKGGADISIEKNIPLMSGLGGGQRRRSAGGGAFRTETGCTAQA